MKQSKGPLILHAIFWTIILMIIVGGNIFDTTKHTMKDYFISYVVYGIINISIFYINYIFLIPSLIKKRKKYLIYVLAFLLLIAVSVVAKTAIDRKSVV